MGDFRVIRTEPGICPICEDERELEIGIRLEKLLIRKEPIEVEAQVEHCPVCGEFFATSDADEVAMQDAYRQYRNRHQLLQPEEIRAIRERYGLGQRAFSRVLGWGEITVHRYEAGSLQDEAHNDILFLIRDADNFVRLFEKNRAALSQRQVRRTEERLAALRGEEQKDYLREYFES